MVRDLKQGAPLVLGGGGAGVQRVNAALAVEEALAETRGLLVPGTRYDLATGDKDVLLAFLCAGRRARRRLEFARAQAEGLAEKPLPPQSGRRLPSEARKDQFSPPLLRSLPIHS